MGRRSPFTVGPIQQQVDAFIAQRFAARRSTLPHFKIVTAYTPQAFLPYFYNLVESAWRR